MSQQMSINVEVVNAGVKQISDAIAVINQRNTAFLQLLQGHNQKTENKFTLLKTLEDKISQEAENINKTIQATEEIKQALDRYAALAAEVDDDSVFR